MSCTCISHLWKMNHDEMRRNVIVTKSQNMTHEGNLAVNKENEAARRENDALGVSRRLATAVIIASLPILHDVIITRSRLLFSTWCRLVLVDEERQRGRREDLGQRKQRRKSGLNASLRVSFALFCLVSRRRPHDSAWLQRRAITCTFRTRRFARRFVNARRGR